MTPEGKILIFMILMMIVIPFIVWAVLTFLEKMGIISEQINEAEREMIEAEQGQYQNELENDLWNQLT